MRVPKALLCLATLAWLAGCSDVPSGDYDFVTTGLWPEVEGLTGKPKLLWYSLEGEGTRYADGPMGHGRHWFVEAAQGPWVLLGSAYIDDEGQRQVVDASWRWVDWRRVAEYGVTGER